MDLKKFQRLVFKFANKWYGMEQDDLFTFDDLVQEGWLALWKAYTKFDESKGNKFITYGYVALQNRYKDLFNHRYKKDMKFDYVEQVTEDGEILDIEDTKSDFSEQVVMNEILDKLSEKARQVAEYIIEDDAIEQCKNLKDIVRYWRKLEQEFGELADVKQEIEQVLLESI